MRATHIGKVLGAFGLLLLLSSPFTLFLTSGSVTATVFKVVAGLVLLGVYFATNFKQFGQFASRKSSFFFASTVLTAVVVLGGLVAVNYIAFKKNQRWDLTKAKIFTLAPQTSATLASLPEKVRAIGFIPSTHPSYDALQELFQRYHAQAPEKFDFTFKDPRRNPDLAAKYQLKEGQTTVVLVRGEGDKASHTTLSVISEQDLTNALIKLNAVGTQKVYFLTGHGEWPLERQPSQQGRAGDGLAELAQQLAQEGYTAEPLNLVGRQEVPRDASLVLIAGAKTPYTAPEVEALRKYLGEGGRMLYFAEAGVTDGLDALLSDYALTVDDGIAADAQFNAGNPYVIVSMFYGPHEIGRLLKERALNIELPTPRSLSLLRQGQLPGVKAEPVVLTSPYGWVESKPEEDATPSDGEKTGQLTLVAAVTRDTKDAQNKRYDEARLVAVGDSELILDPNWGHEANRNLVMNALGWASNQIEKITLRPPDRGVSTLELSTELLDNIRFVSTDLLPLSLLGLGLAIWLARRNK